ncbi:hypothetical protein [Microbacterium sp. BDGP8]|uniref:hypothetical protein n=1 Tax=Microbacterium sp. BDGP8 TaxID=3035531 RepID=UPI00249DE54D|nr:hypothetical protein [Microbacterium sp. BDGP8]WHE35181.1 hypothetical protein P6897_10780 [Microbacterium sp. BDGP8]
MTARVLLLCGLILLAFDVARPNITGVALLGIVLMTISAFLSGVFTRDFWVADDEMSARLSAIDQEIGR